MKHFSEISATAERVVDAAEGLIQARGYNGFSYDDVARLVGIKKPSIHHHFATKSELAAVVAQRYTHRFKELLLQIEGSSVKAAERLSAYAALFEKTFSTDKHLCVCGMLGAESSSLPEIVNHEVQRFFDANLDWLTQIADDGQRAGQLTSKLSPQSIAETYLSLLEGAMVVGRGMQKASGPAIVADHFLKTLTVN
ncbi:TetR/AcrR family transcriptional regulator [Undibacterium curvum]|jgi:TetR/AcrR family transcriptional repressor of nem operon|uniref:TetR/AcrR family transcriptional regulator n=1 Tax=Undibacterium curvum TaxID=2762294 RepID=A0ABR7A0D0_9BURK|nr:TetR/AcrR family transcriptional regulator [Undibacterium curvum]MBC3930277.1 TetR/AcrR family transcriptional regulator [Undibacterium curvum]